MGNRRRRRNSRAWGIGGVALLAAGVIALAGLALGQGRSDSPASAGAVPVLPSSSPTPTAEPLRVAAVGDSVTAADSPDFSSGRIGRGSWLSYVLGDGIIFAGGWALGGVQTSTMVDNVTTYPGVDVLVLLTGSNDYVHDVSFATTTKNFDAIVGTVAAKSVLVSSVPPLDRDPKATQRFNADLAALAEERGWSFVDGAGSTHGDDGKYLPGYSLDGIHPTPEAAEAIGTKVREAALAMP